MGSSAEPGLVFDRAVWLAADVLFFRSLFDFQKAEVRQIEQRMNRRYTPGRAFPLRAELGGADGARPVEIHNLSATGIALAADRGTTPPAGLVRQGGHTVGLRLTLEEHVLDLKARTAHARPGDDDTVCGFELLFDDFSRQKAWLQLLQPVALGTTLAPVDPALVRQNEPQFIKQVYRGEADSVLNAWLARSAGTPLHSLEFQARGLFVRADAQARVLEVFFREEMEDTHKARSPPRRSTPPAAPARRCAGSSAGSCPTCLRPSRTTSGRFCGRWPARIFTC